MSPDQPPPRLTLISGRSSHHGSPPVTERVQVAPEVAHALGAGTVMRLRADTGLTEFVCQFCYQPASLDDTGATVIAFRWVDGLTVVRFAHPDCSPSAVLHILRRSQPSDIRVRAACWLPPEPAAPAWASRAVLLISHDVRAWPRTRTYDATERYTLALHTIGFTPLTDLNQAPPILTQLTATIDTDDSFTSETEPRTSRVGQARVVVEHPDGLLFDGDLNVSEPWQQTARARGHVVIITGPGSHLAGLPHGRLPDPTTGPALAAAAALRNHVTITHDTHHARRA